MITQPERNWKKQNQKEIYGFHKACRHSIREDLDTDRQVNAKGKARGASVNYSRVLIQISIKGLKRAKCLPPAIRNG